MGDHASVKQAATCQQYRALLAVAEAIVAHRDLQALFHDLAGRLHQVVRFDYLLLVLHDEASDSMRLHVLETSEPTFTQAGMRTPVHESPAGLVWQTQQPLLIPDLEQESRWPRLREEVFRPHGMTSLCELPLTTARHRLGALAFVSRQPAAYDAADVDFLQLVANQVAVAVENALAFQEIQALKDKLAQENLYLQQEVRTEHDFGETVGDFLPSHFFGRFSLFSENVLASGEFDHLGDPVAADPRWVRPLALNGPRSGTG